MNFLQNLKPFQNEVDLHYSLNYNDSQTDSSQMLTKVDCVTDVDCPFQYYCSIAQICKHNEMFPLQWYPLIIYTILPFALTICNIGGLSGGVFKIVLLMDLLNYPVSEATTLAYSMITGAAFANFILLIPRRHPTLNAPLVDYWLVFVLLPCKLTGTTVGVLLGKTLNDLTKDILVIVVCLYFAYKYFQRFKHRKRVGLGFSIDSRADIFDSVDPVLQRPHNISVYAARLKFDRHQASYQVKQIMLSIVFFIALEIITACCQGRILIKFEKCSISYILFLAGYLAIMTMVIIVMYKLSTLRVLKYRKINYPYALKLDELSVYSKIAVGGIVAGILQGVIGLGSGHMITLVLLSLNFRPEVTSGTTGYIVFFVGSASMIESFILGDSKWEESLFLFLISFVGSLILTFFSLRYLKRHSKLDTTIILILASIYVVSIVGVISNVVMEAKTFGFEQLVQAKSLC